MVKKRITIDHINFPESPLKGRIKWAYNKIPLKSKTLLDGGCAWGYGTRFFKKKCINTYGIDPNKDFIKIAKERYSHIKFINCGLEKTPFQNNFFDVIILNDVLEHVKDEKRVLNEMYRVLKKGGNLIITTPHKGLFSFMDSDNYVFLIRTKIPKLYKKLYKMYKGEYPKKIRPGYEDWHKHYSVKEIVHMLNSSKFNNHFSLVKTFRSGFFIGPFVGNLQLIGDTFLGRRITSFLLKPLLILSNIDYWIPYNKLSYNLAIRLIKK
ncbi:MAG TPA: class I SAM-dependent methyltransferase [Candidatus Pacearchaeota archaeon]|nr:class I SAM-dependent methyltransferase [Candidatus Pacearchaeota archaeon]